MSIAVHPDFRRRQVGHVLVDSLLQEMALRGRPAVELIVRHENVGARRLYEELGWRPVRELKTRDGSRRWQYMVRFDGRRSR